MPGQEYSDPGTFLLSLQYYSSFAPSIAASAAAAAASCSWRAVQPPFAFGAYAYTTYITGMAYGVDIWAGQIVVRLRKHKPALHLIAAVPFRGFEDRWSTDWKRAYQELLEQADLVKYICPGYNAGAYQRRNEWMVDHSSRVIAVFNGEPSGTKNTIDYAKRNGVLCCYLEL